MKIKMKKEGFRVEGERREVEGKKVYLRTESEALVGTAAMKPSGIELWG